MRGQGGGGTILHPFFPRRGWGGATANFNLVAVLDPNQARIRREGAEMPGDKGCTDRRMTNRTHLYVEEAVGSTAFRFGYSGSRKQNSSLVLGLDPFPKPGFKLFKLYIKDFFHLSNFLLSTHAVP